MANNEIRLSVPLTDNRSIKKLQKIAKSGAIKVHADSKGFYASGLLARFASLGLVKWDGVPQSDSRKAKKKEFPSERKAARSYLKKQVKKVWEALETETVDLFDPQDLTIEQIKEMVYESAYHHLKGKSLVEWDLMEAEEKESLLEEVFNTKDNPYKQNYA